MIFASYYKPHMKLFLLDMVCALCISGVELMEQGGGFAKLRRAQKLS